jgi:hypothetical protein
MSDFPTKPTTASLKMPLAAILNARPQDEASVAQSDDGGGVGVFDSFIAIHVQTNYLFPIQMRTERIYRRIDSSRIELHAWTVARMSNG